MNLTAAYLDAGSGALIVQLLVGGAAGIVAFVRFRWRNLTGTASNANDAPASKTAASSSVAHEE
jgi:hypothetical protein